MPSDRGPVAVFAFILLLIVADLVADSQSNIELPHLLLEILAGAAALWGVATLGGRLRSERARSGALAADLARAHDDAERWARDTRETLRSLESAVEGQFDRWGLTQAERDVAFQLLKGLRLKEIAAARNTSERTVRQQALAIYGKAGVDGRTEFAGFFLQGLHVAEDGRPAEAAGQES